MDLEYRTLALSWDPKDGIPASTWADSTVFVADLFGLVALVIETDRGELIALMIRTSWDKRQAYAHPSRRLPCPRVEIRTPATSVG